MYTFAKSIFINDLSNLFSARIYNTCTQTQWHKQGPIVFLTSSLVYCSLSRLIPDFCFCSSSHCIKCPIIPLTKVTFSNGEEATPFLIAGECQSATCPIYINPKYVIRSTNLESKSIHNCNKSLRNGFVGCFGCKFLNMRWSCKPTVSIRLEKTIKKLLWDKELSGQSARADL